MNKSQADIVQLMGKDRAWVSRSIKRIQADFSILYGTPEENRLVRENLARLQSLYAEARKTAFSTVGHSRIAALRLAAELVHQQSQYEITVGYVANRRTPTEANGPTMEQLRDEISDQDLEMLFEDMMAAKGWSPPAIGSAGG